MNGTASSHHRRSPRYGRHRDIPATPFRNRKPPAKPGDNTMDHDCIRTGIMPGLAGQSPRLSERGKGNGA